jgi:hypothetical protein
MTITLPCPPHGGNRKKMTTAEITAISVPLINRCKKITGYTLEQLRNAKPPEVPLLRTRMALAHVILAAGVTCKTAAVITGTSYHAAHWSQWRARKLYTTDDTFRNLCNAIAGNDKTLP